MSEPTRWGRRGEARVGRSETGEGERTLVVGGRDWEGDPVDHEAPEKRSRGRTEYLETFKVVFHGSGWSREVNSVHLGNREVRVVVCVGLQACV